MLSVAIKNPTIVNGRDRKWVFDVTSMPRFKKAVKIRQRRAVYSTSGGYRTAQPQPSETQVSTGRKVLDWLKFRNLVAQWHEERGAASSIAEMCTTPAYLSILGMGKDALPFLLRQLQLEGSNPDHWFVALFHITGEDPVPEEDRGDLHQMAKAWLKWAQQYQDGW